MIEHHLMFIAMVTQVQEQECVLAAGSSEDGEEDHGVQHHPTHHNTGATLIIKTYMGLFPT